MSKPKTALGRYLQNKKLRKATAAAARVAAKEAADTLRDPVQARLDAIAARLPALLAGSLRTELVAAQSDLGRRLGAPPADPTEEVAFWLRLDRESRDLEALLTSAIACGDDVKSQSSDELKTLRDTVAGEVPALAACYESELERLAELDVQAHAKFNARDFAGAQADAATVQADCHDAAAALPAGRQFVAKSKPVLKKIKQLRDKPRRARSAAPQLVRLGRVEATMNGQALAFDFGGAMATCETLAAVRRLAFVSSTKKGAFKRLKRDVDAELAALKGHAMAAFGRAELTVLDGRVADSGALCRAEDGGWQKGLSQLQAVREELAQVKKMLDVLTAASLRQPAIRASLEGAGMEAAVAEKIARHAVKLIAEEGCTDDEAIAMAKDADDYAANAGLGEPDALMSARVKHTLQREGVPADKAKAVGRNVRCTGAADGEDTKAVARQVARMSLGVITALNNAGAVTVTCRGPVTQAIPDLCGEQPRGWPPEMTWDNVPGVYSPLGNQVVVGTMAAPDGKRKVPGPGEGPLPHGTPDLVGHESGHAFDVAGGGLRSRDAAFLAARNKDCAADPAARPPRVRKMVPPGDNYFLSSAEGGANTAGAISETFAESFAMHFAGAPRWPELEKFWLTRPFGI